jgi:hypothetical protein
MFGLFLINGHEKLTTKATESEDLEDLKDKIAEPWPLLFCQTCPSRMRKNWLKQVTR